MLSMQVASLRPLPTCMNSENILIVDFTVQLPALEGCRLTVTSVYLRCFILNSNIVQVEATYKTVSVVPCRIHYTISVCMWMAHTDKRFAEQSWNITVPYSVSIIDRLLVLPETASRKFQFVIYSHRLSAAWFESVYQSFWVFGRTETIHKLGYSLIPFRFS